MVVCDKCLGFGKLEEKCNKCGQTLVCDVCNGTGWVKSKKD